jgi:23S rRNA (cytidine2498-2'-O)-methyltransferase
MSSTDETLNNKLTTICLTRLGQERYLSDEIALSLNLGLRSSPIKSTHTAPQVVELSHSSHHELGALPIFFSVQCLPNPKAVHADSISIWSKEILGFLVERFSDSPQPWTLQIFDTASIESGERFARAERITESVIELLKQKRRSYLRELKDTPSRKTTLIQVALVTPTQGFISSAEPELQAQYRSAIALDCAGYHAIADDKRPPSRAFKKLREAIEVFSLTPKRGETAVDLGASPGGWSYVLRQLGLTVTAVDRSPLADTLMHTRGISWSSGNALTWQPPNPVDWLVCDVITAPENTAKILKSWITQKLCRNFCVTVKFKGDPDLKTLLTLADLLRQNTTWFDGRQLTHNKNELTLVGTI